MKKLFFFKSSSSAGKHEGAPLSTEKQVHGKNPQKKVSNDKIQERVWSSKGVISEDQNPIRNEGSPLGPGLKRSLSFSSAAFDSKDLDWRNWYGSNDGSKSPSSGPCGIPKPKPGHLSGFRSITPERPLMEGRHDFISTQNLQHWNKPFSTSRHNGLSDNSSLCSSDLSARAFDVYVDGEEHHERHKNSYYSNRKYPPTSQNSKEEHRSRSRSRSFSETIETQLQHPSKDHSDIAKHVIERLSNCHVSSEKDFDSCLPITVDDICTNTDLSVNDGKNLLMDSNIIDGGFPGSGSIDVELQKKYREAEERVLIICEEIENEYFTRDSGLSMPALIRTIRNLIEERKSLAMDVSSALLGRIQDRVSANEQLRLGRAELDTRTRKLEREKNELQSGLERELDRRSREWSMKLERCHTEEQRLHARVRELAEQNVSLQREVSSFIGRESKSKATMECSNSQVTGLTARLNEANSQTQQLQQNLLELKEKLLATEEERCCFKRNYEEKDMECRELHKSISRLVRMCNEQDKTIDGLRARITDDTKDDKVVDRVHMEQLRLVGVEQSLRRELESYRSEADSLRQENIDLLNRLGGKEGPHLCSIFNLDRVLQSRVCTLQNQGLSMLKESAVLSSKLLESLKGVCNGSVSKQFLIESDVKVQGFKRGVENLRQSLETASSLLQESSCLLEPQSRACRESTILTSEDNLRELKAEMLVTTALRDKLYSKEMEVEQLHAELAAAVRGNDILQCETQNALDVVSCLTHKLKDLELQMLKKDEAARRLENELQESTKELAIMKGILPKVSEQRDEMWAEVKKLSENNMLLNTEVGMLNKKVEAMDEDVHIKEGQITILKDALAKNKAYDLLSSPVDLKREFLLD